MKLDELAKHTIDVEFPGMAPIDAFLEAQERCINSIKLMNQLKTAIEKLEYAFEQATYEYKVHANNANVLENYLEDVF